jgi:allantoate deiminase
VSETETTSTLDTARLLQRLEDLRRIGRTRAGGVTRLAWSPEDVAARALVAQWMQDAGLEVSVDAATNVIGRLPGDGPAIATGSHLDSVVDGGAYAGAYGVVAAIEVAAALRGRLRHPLAVVAFADEEGVRVPGGFVGSSAIAGVAIETRLRDDDGTSLAKHIRSAGGDPDDLASAAWRRGDMLAFVELHVEEGPMLEAARCPIGIVTGYTGRRSLEIAIEGVPNHAGTTPMDLRSDALVAAARLTLAVEELATDGHVRTATVGSIDAWPNVRHVVPGRVVMGVDLRDMDEVRLSAAKRMLDHTSSRVAQGTRTMITVREVARQASQPTAPEVQRAVEAAADAAGVRAMALPSGAGHDAQVMAALAPAGMIFVPTCGGLSNSPDEHTEAADLVTGADVLLRTILHLDTT